MFYYYLDTFIARYPPGTTHCLANVSLVLHSERPRSLRAKLASLSSTYSHVVLWMNPQLCTK
jgi:hypothetical protein